MWTLSEFQSQLSSEVDQSDSAPAVTDARYTIRRNFLNRALRDFSGTFDWGFLVREVNTLTSNASMMVRGVATIPMPTDFSKLTTFPKVTYDGSDTREFAEIDVEKIGEYPISAKYLYFLKSSSSPTINMILHASTLVSGASIYFAYKSSPQSLASPVDIANIPDPNYLLTRAAYYEYKSTEDARWVDSFQQSELIMQRMIENEISRGRAYQEDRTKTYLETKFNFRIGEDG